MDHSGEDGGDRGTRAREAREMQVLGVRIDAEKPGGGKGGEGKEGGADDPEAWKEMERHGRGNAQNDVHGHSPRNDGVRSRGMGGGTEPVRKHI